VQVIDWKDSYEMTYNVLMGTLNPTHSLTPAGASHISKRRRYTSNYHAEGLDSGLFTKFRGRRKRNHTQTQIT